MWFLWFYLISTGITLLFLFIISWSVSCKLKRDKIKTNKSSFIEIISVTLPYLIPFLNIIFILIGILNQNKVYEKIKNKTIRGKLKDEEK